MCNFLVSKSVPSCARGKWTGPGGLAALTHTAKGLCVYRLLFVCVCMCNFLVSKSVQSCARGKWTGPGRLAALTHTATGLCVFRLLCVCVCVCVCVCRRRPEALLSDGTCQID
jgi:hypothetical protein